LIPYVTVGKENSSNIEIYYKDWGSGGGLPIEAFDQIRAGVVADRSQLWKDLSLPFYG
jgi:hypothetical protein